MKIKVEEAAKVAKYCLSLGHTYSYVCVAYAACGRYVHLATYTHTHTHLYVCVTLSLQHNSLGHMYAPKTLSNFYEYLTFLSTSTLPPAPTDCGMWPCRIRLQSLSAGYSYRKMLIFRHTEPILSPAKASAVVAAQLRCCMKLLLFLFFAIFLLQHLLQQLIHTCKCIGLTHLQTCVCACVCVCVCACAQFIIK